jgi:hypothetical protein
MLRKGMRSGPLVKASKNAISTLIWLLVGLHLVGLLPGLLEAMDSQAISVGDTRIFLGPWRGCGFLQIQQVGADHRCCAVRS